MNENKKIAVNSIILFGRLCVVSIISLVGSRVVLQALGVSDFGLYNVVGGIVALLNIFNTAMVSTTYRYIAFELGRGDQGDTNKVFNTSLAIHAGFAAVILVLGLSIGLLYVNNFLNVALEKLGDARFVFFISIVTTMISTLFVPYHGLLVAYERFHVPAIIDVIANLVRLGLLFVLLHYGGNRIRLYSLIMLSFIVLQSLLVYLYSYKNFKDVIAFKIQRDGKLYKEMFGFSGWILFGATASVGKTQGSAIIINYFFGTIVNGAYAVATQVEHFIQLFARSLSNAAIPQITKSFSSGDLSRSTFLASYISKYTFVLMSLVAFPVLMEMDFLLELWLKEVPEGATIFCRLIVLGALLSSVGEGIPALVQASGRVKYFQLTMSTISLMGLPCSILFFFFGYAPYTILVIYCVISVLAAIIRLYLLKRILNIDVLFFVKTSYLRVIYISIPLGFIYFFYNSNNFTFWQHILGILILEVLLIVDIVLLGMDNNERTLLERTIQAKMNKRAW